MEAEGVVVLASTAGAPTQIVHASGSIYAVLPTTLKVKPRTEFFRQRAHDRISSDGGATWTFIDAGGKGSQPAKKSSARRGQIEPAA